MTGGHYSEKVSVNVSSSTLSEIDLLVDNGYYANRSDFINYALRSALDENRSTIERIIDVNTKAHDEKAWGIGIIGFSAKEIERMFNNGQKIAFSGYGVLSIDPACDEKKLFAVIESIDFRGKVHCTPSVRAHYGLR